MDEFDFLWEGGPKILKGGAFLLSTDSVLLGSFVSARRNEKGIDLGCAGGILSILVLARNAQCHMTGLEWNPEEAERARKNMALNHLQDRSDILCGDIRKHRDYFRPGSFDFVLSNPPYFPVNSGPASPDESRAGARDERNCTLEELLTAAAYLCRYGGKVSLVHKPERLAEIFGAMKAHGIEPKRIRFAAKTADAAPSLVLIEGRRGGSPGLIVEPVLPLQNGLGGESEELRTIYHRTKKTE